MKLTKAIFLVSLLSVSLLPAGCGGPLVEVRETDDGPPKPSPQPQPKPGNGSLTFDEAIEIMDTYCASCHANSPWMGSETSLKRSSVKNQVSGSRMPPDFSTIKMPDDVRKKLLTYPF